MKPYNSHEKKVLVYAITDTSGAPLDLMNIQSFKNGELDSVITFVGRHDRDEYVRVAEAMNLSAPGAVFNYSRYVRQQERILDKDIRIYHRKLAGNAYHDGRAVYPGDGELSPEDELIEALRLFHTQR